MKKRYHKRADAFHLRVAVQREEMIKASMNAIAIVMDSKAEVFEQVICAVASGEPNPLAAGAWARLGRVVEYLKSC